MFGHFGLFFEKNEPQPRCPPQQSHASGETHNPATDDCAIERLLSHDAKILLERNLQLTAVKALGKTSWRICLDTAKAHQPQKKILGEPLLVTLGSEEAHEKLHFAFRNGFGKRNEKIRLPQIGVVLWNLVFENEMVAESIPGKFREQAVVLMEIMPEMSKDQIWRKGPFNIFKRLFDGSAKIRKKAVAKGFHNDGALPDASEKSIGALFGFSSPLRIRTENEPVNLKMG
jgi:hypothetical protein